MTLIAEDGVCRASIFDPATGDKVAVNAIVGLDGIGGYAPEYFETGEGRNRIIRKVRRVAMTLNDLENLWQLLAWRDAETPLQAVLLGNGRNSQLYSSFLLDVIPLGRPAPAHAAWQAIMYLSDFNADWTQHVNLLQKFGWGALDAGVPAGYVSTDAANLSLSYSFADTVLTITADSTGVASAEVATLHIDIPFPGLVGAALRFGFGVGDTVSSNASAFRWRVDEYDFAGVVGSGTFGTAIPVSTGSVQSVEHTLQDSDLYTIRSTLEIEYSGDFGSETAIKITLPRLRTDGIATETRF